MPARILEDRPLTQRERYLRYKARHPERINANKRRWERANPDRVRAQRQRSYERGYLKNVRPKRIQELYGISADEYQEMFDSQDGLCAICGNPETYKTKTGAVRLLSVDHDHATGKVRALLCGLCNSGLGKFREDVSLLAEAIEYIVAFSDDEE